MPAGLLDEAVNHRQAQPRALTDRLGRKERLHRAGAGLGGHAFARVRDRQADVVAHVDADLLCDIGVIKLHVAGFQRDFPA